MLFDIDGCCDMPGAGRRIVKNKPDGLFFTRLLSDALDGRREIAFAISSSRVAYAPEWN